MRAAETYESWKLRWDRRQAEIAKNGLSYRSRALNLQYLGFQSYTEYLKSDLWKRVRGKVYARKGRRCWLCPYEANAIHHNRYRVCDLLGKCLDHVFPICNRCHDEIEFSKKGHRKLCVEGARSKFKQKEQEGFGFLCFALLNYDADP